MHSFSLLTFATFLLSFAAPSNPVGETTALAAALAAIDEVGLRADLEFVASDELEGRDSPSRGLDLCAKFLETRLRHIGLQPGAHGGSFMDSYPFHWRALDVHVSSMAIQRGEKSLLLAPGEDYYFKSTSQLFEHGLDASVVVVGDGNPSAIESADLKGRWALCLMKNAAVSRIDDRLIERGAAGVIYAPGDGYKGKGVADKYERTMKAALRGVRGEGRRNLPQVFWTRSTLEEVCGWLEVEADSLAPGSTLDCTISERRQLTNPRGVQRLNNVCGFWPGSDLAREVIVVSAHYDHVGTKNGKIWNGADDNGSGTVGLLALAEALVEYGPLRRSVLLLWVSAEEKGLFGSHAWTTRPWLPDGCYPVANINIDMIGRNAADDLCITPTKKLKREYNGLVKLAERCGPQEGFPSFRSADQYWRRSDHMNFAENLDLPVTFLFADVHADYHQPTDTIEKIDFDKIRRATRLVFRLLDGLQDDELELDDNRKLDPAAFARSVQEGQAMDDMDLVADAVTRFAVHAGGAFPQSLDELATELPKDPWGNAFHYRPPTADGPFELASLGADGADGGDGAAADIAWKPEAY